MNIRFGRFSSRLHDSGLVDVLNTKYRKLIMLVVALLLLLILLAAPPAIGQTYHTYPQIEAALHNAETDHPTICRRARLGTTVQGRSMWALCITDHPGVEEDEPEFRYISTMHGNEIIGVEMCLHLIEHLTANYGIDSRVTDIVNEIEIWIVPCMNPDGFVASTRTNVHGADLNRNFPCPYTSSDNSTTNREPEVANIMNWCFSNSFTLAANLHSGALLVNYPYDANASGSSVYTASPDDDMFIWISEQYSIRNSPMWNSPSFPHGITNGADWYVIYGGMQDWSYVYMGTNEVTIELANGTPPAAQIPVWWNNNRDAMLAYLESCLTGVRGVVTDAETSLPIAANASIVGRSHLVYCDPDLGDYHRMLLPGVYDLRFDAQDYDPARRTQVAVEPGAATRVNATLFAPPALLSPNGGAQWYVGVPAAISWTARAFLAYQVQSTLNYGAIDANTGTFEDGVLPSGYTTGGNAEWVITTSSAHTGIRAARTGALTHNQSSWLRRTVQGPATASFWYRVSSESGYDYFDFSVDGEQRVRQSGEVEWTSYSTELAAGTHGLDWLYTKDGSVSSGSDAVWIDDVLASRDLTTWFDIVDRTEPGTASIFWTPTQESATAGVRVRALYDGGVDGRWVKGNDSFTISLLPDILGDLNCDGARNNEDTAAFVLALTDRDAYMVAHPTCDLMRADMNIDSKIDGKDVQAFVSILISS